MVVREENRADSDKTASEQSDLGLLVLAYFCSKL